MNRRWMLATFALTGGFAFAQVVVNPPFFNTGSTAFEAQISSINSGPILSSTAVVSSDRKYVTMGQQATVQQVQQFRTFTFAGPNSGGFVGTTSANQAPSVLDKTGMTFIAARP